jgi:hypothetical protein
MHEHLISGAKSANSVYRRERNWRWPVGSSSLPRLGCLGEHPGCPVYLVVYWNPLLHVLVDLSCQHLTFWYMKCVMGCLKKHGGHENFVRAFVDLTRILLII